MINIYITIGGQGTRLKYLSPKDKHKLYYKDKRIIDWMLEIVPEARLLGNKKTNSRKETLLEIANQQNVLIIDCDIIPFGLDISLIDTGCDSIFTFESDRNKWGSVLINDNTVIEANEKTSISNTKCSGVYFCKDLRNVIDKMTDNNSIVSGMLGAKVIKENTFKRFGDVEDYMEAISHDYN